MTTGQLLILGILALTLGMFLWGRVRHDVVAFGALLACAVGRLLPASSEGSDQALAMLSGFAHPAVFTVAAVLMMSAALQESGALQPLARRVASLGDRPVLLVAALVGGAAVLSMFMNNVGALALLMPVAIQACNRGNTSPSQVLLPLSFGSLLGGMCTLVGTPPNLILAGIRQQELGEGYGMFAFLPVGIVITIAGCSYLALIGWRLTPKNPGSNPQEVERFAVDHYVSEVIVPDGSPWVGTALRDVRELYSETVTTLALIRGNQRFARTQGWQRLTPGDVLVVQTDSDALGELLQAGGLEAAAPPDPDADRLSTDEVGIIESVVPPGAPLVGRTIAWARPRRRFGINLVAISRAGAAFQQRLREVRILAGDVILLQGDQEGLDGFLAHTGALPLAERGVSLGSRRDLWPPLLVFATAVGLAASGLFSVPVAFGIGVLGMLACGHLPLSRLYTAVDWSVIVLLGAMIGVGSAFQAQGVPALIAENLLAVAGDQSPQLVLALLMVVTLLLTDLMNNAATAIVMAPIALALATGLGVTADPFLMAVAIAASSSFLSPIGHQNNVLVMGPGGYRFGDYWKVGLPLDALIVAIGTCLLPVVFPF